MLGLFGTKNTKAEDKQQPSRILSRLYSVFCRAGLFIIKTLKRAAGILRVPAAFVCRAFSAPAGRLCRRLSAYRDNVLAFGGGREAISGKRGLSKAVCFVRLAFAYAMRGGLRTSAAYIAPVLAAAVFAGTLYSLSRVTYAVEVSYGGDVIACVASESDYNDAAQSILSNIADTELKNSVDLTASFRLVPTSADNIVPADGISKILLDSITPALTEASGLYIDGEFIAAAAADTKIKGALDALLDSYLAQDGVEKAVFNNDITLRSGYYRASDVISGDELRARLDAPSYEKEIYVSAADETTADISAVTGADISRIAELNPSLGDTPAEGTKVIVEVPHMLYSIKLIKSESHEEEIAYGSIEIPDDTLYAGSKQVAVNGQNGASLITEEVVLIDGVEMSRTQTDFQVISEPVNEEIKVGTKNVVKMQIQALSEGPGDIAEGSMSAPIGIGDRVYISSYYGDNRGHKGWDIAAPSGTDIYAAASGTVVSINCSGSAYGLHFVVDHGNGLHTLYAHCSEINVEAGQTVAAGEKIAEVGSTGRATGSHLHFEIRVNGSPVDPAPYMAGIVG